MKNPKYFIDQETGYSVCVYGEYISFYKLNYLTYERSLAKDLLVNQINTDWFKCLKHSNEISIKEKSAHCELLETEVLL